MRSLLAITLTAILAAGCLSGSNGDGDQSIVDPGTGTNDGTDWVAKILVQAGDGHDHQNWTQHVGMSTPNFRELAWDPLGIPQFDGTSAGGYFCGGSATTAEGRRLSVISSLDTSVAFVVVDSTDPVHPFYVGDYILDNGQTYDVDITPDGKHVAIGANVGPMQSPPGSAPAATPQMVTLGQSFRDGCTGEVRRGPDQTVAAGPSTILVSLAIPEAPAFEDLVPAPVLGPHSVSTAEIDGTTYVASSTTNLGQAVSYYQFFQVVDTPLPGSLPGGVSLGPSKLVQVSTMDAQLAGDPMGVVNGHLDAEIAIHPVTGKAVVYLSNWGGGLQLLDFSVPAAPTFLGKWSDTGPSAGALHSTRSIEGVHNGRHYVLAGQEFISHPLNRPSGWVYILDDTDPNAITEVGRWTLPMDVDTEWNGIELFSTHYFRVLNDTVFVAMYHGGVWAFKLDLENPANMALPRSVGAFVPDHFPERSRTLGGKGSYDYTPFVLDVFPSEDGTLAIYDGLSGFYSVQYDPSKDMPAPEPWPAEGKQL